MNTTQKVSGLEKLGYSLGDAASNLIWATFMYFLQYYYTDVFGIAPAVVGTIMLVARFVDFFTDIAVGIWADRVNTRWGKYRPFLLYGSVPFALVAILLYSAPEMSQAAKFWYALITYTGMMMIYTVVNIPYSAMLGVISPSNKERTLVASWRFVAAFLGNLFVQATMLWFITSLGKGDEKWGFTLTLVIYGAMAAIMFIITALSTKERVTPPADAKISLKADLKDLVKNVPWFMLFLIGIFTMSFMAIRNGSILYYFKYFVSQKEYSISLFGHSFTGAYSAAYMVIGTLASLAAVIVAGKLAQYIEKKKIFIVAMTLTGIATAISYTVDPNSLTAIFVFQIIISFFSNMQAPIVWSMYADTADYSEWKNHRRATGLVFSAATAAQKIGGAVGGVASGWILASFGYDALKPILPDTIHGIVLLMTLIPAGCAIGAAVCMIFYALDGKMMQKIETELQIRKK